MNVEEFMKQCNAALYSGEITGKTEVIMTTLDNEFKVHSVEVQGVSGCSVLSIQTDEEY